MANRSRYGHRWRQLRAQVIAEETHCWLCKQPVRKDIPYPHPLSPSVDHVAEAADNPRLFHARSNLRLTHLRCNLSRGGRYGAARQRRVDAKLSRNW